LVPIDRKVELEIFYGGVAGKFEMPFVNRETVVGLFVGEGGIKLLDDVPETCGGGTRN